MRSGPFTRKTVLNGVLRALGLLIVLAGAPAWAQEDAPVVDNANGWQRYDWLKPAEEKQQQQASGETATVRSGDVGKDPFAVISTGSLWQDSQVAVYTRRLTDGVTATSETSSTSLSEASGNLPLTDDLSHGQKVGLLFQPAQELTLSGNVHESTTDSTMPGDSTVTSGAGLYAEGHLPSDATLTLGMNTDRTGTDTGPANVTTDTTYDAQYQQPLPGVPLTAQFKSHLEELNLAGAPTGRMPSLEQSLVWKPVGTTTVQMGLRQQQYQEYPGINNSFNAALFADFSQKLVNDISWHSYAEVVNTRNLVDQAPLSPIASGANGTAQATGPGNNGNLNPLPTSLDDQTLTFTTGPSFRLQKDISASVEYSNRWDKTPAAGGVGDEQRVSVSIKGSF